MAATVLRRAEGATPGPVAEAQAVGAGPIDVDVPSSRVAAAMAITRPRRPVLLRSVAGERAPVATAVTVVVAGLAVSPRPFHSIKDFFLFTNYRA